MKRILTPKVEQPEVAIYTCDFIGKEMPHGPAVTVEVRCGYGSKRDMISYRLDLCDDALDDLMAFVRSRMYPRKVSEASVERSFDGESLRANATEFLEDQMGEDVLAMYPNPRNCSP